MLQDIAFIKVFFPILMVVGVSLLGTWGVRGITQQRTYVFGRMYGGGVGYGEVEGLAAVGVGALHLAIAAGIALVLGPFSYYLWFPQPR